jgi:Cu/Ag efflux pump CusA
MMSTKQLPPTVQAALGEQAATDLVAWLDKQLQESQLPISALVARQKVNVLMLEKISNLLLAGTPELIQRENGRQRWRVPVDLTLPDKGRVGRVGQIEVDAHYGEILYDDALLEQIEKDASELLQQ